MTEVFTLQIELIRGPCSEREWMRKVEVPSDWDLDDLHFVIQNVINFDNDHLYEFYLGKTQRQRTIVFGEPDEWGSAECKSVETELKELFPLQGMKLFYIFDFGDHWLFQIKKERKIKQIEPRKKYPRVIEKIGRNPLQYGRSW